MSWWIIVLLIIIALLVVVTIHDLTQKRHAILRNFPIIGHLRFLLEKAGPELRQYIVTDNNEERPFSRDQRRWVYSTAKKENPYFGFGTDDDIDRPHHIILRHSAFPIASDTHDDTQLPVCKILGGWRQREHAFRPASIINISAMSFGSLSGPAIRGLNEGATLAGCLHNTGEGGISDHHRHGGDLIFQVGTGYFGCRDSNGAFSMDQLLTAVSSAPVKAIEIKLSQGAKPGLGGLLPGAKVTREIAATRGVPAGITVASPARHAAFGDVVAMVDWIESIADATGLPVGIKSAVGQMDFWQQLAEHMINTGRGPDFITIDGGEGGTGAAPLVFTDNVALPFRTGMARVYNVFAAVDLHQHVMFIGSGKLGFPAGAITAMSLGCDMINVAREAMLALGCIQAQKCHTGHCPTGVATQSRRLSRGLDPASKAVRVANYIDGLRHDMLRVAHAGGVAHPALLPTSAVDIIDMAGAPVPVTNYYGVKPGVQRVSDVDKSALEDLMHTFQG